MLSVEHNNVLIVQVWALVIVEIIESEKADGHSWFCSVFSWFPRKDKLGYMVEIIRCEDTEQFHAFS